MSLVDEQLGREALRLADALDLDRRRVDGLLDPAEPLRDVVERSVPALLRHSLATVDHCQNDLREASEQRHQPDEDHQFFYQFLIQ